MARKRWAVAALAAMAGVLGVAGCSSSSSTTSTGSTSSASSTGASAVATKAAPTGTPITVGYLDLANGSYGSPLGGYAAQGAQYYVNSILGGINGHPLKLDVCKVDGTPSADVNCANQFVSEKVVAVVDGGDIGSGASIPILRAAGIPFLAGNADSSQAEAAKSDVYNVGPGQAVPTIAVVKAMKQENLHTVAFVIGDSPTGRAFITQFLQPLATSMGLSISVTYYNATAPDFSVLAADIEAKHPDIGGAVAVDASQATQLVTALRSTGYTGKITLGSTDVSQLVANMGGKAAGVQFETSSTWSPLAEGAAPTRDQADISTFKQSMAAVGQPTALGFQVGAPFQAVADFAKVATGLKTVTAGTVNSGFKALVNWPSFMGPDITCDGTAWPGSSGCATSVFIGEVQSDGSVKPVGDGWSTVAPSDMPK